MKKTSDYNTARKQIINDKNNPQSRRRRAEIRNKDERNIQRYGECPAKFKDFVSEKINEESETRTFKVLVTDEKGNIVDSVEIYPEETDNYVNIKTSDQPDHTGEYIALPVKGV